MILERELESDIGKVLFSYERLREHREADGGVRKHGLMGFLFGYFGTTFEEAECLVNMAEMSGFVDEKDSKIYVKGN